MRQIIVSMIVLKYLHGELVAAGSSHLQIGGDVKEFLDDLLIQLCKNMWSVLV